MACILGRGCSLTHRTITAARIQIEVYRARGAGEDDGREAKLWLGRVRYQGASWVVSTGTYILVTWIDGL